MKRILIVDDNADSANALGAMLELCGHHVEVVVGARHGLLAVERFEPEIVFLDIGMPEMNGYEVAAKIRSEALARQPFLIAFTAWNDEASLERSRVAGFDRHLAKTSPINALLAAVDSASA